MKYKVKFNQKFNKEGTFKLHINICDYEGDYVVHDFEYKFPNDTYYSNPSLRDLKNNIENETNACEVLLDIKFDEWHRQTFVQSSTTMFRDEKNIVGFKFNNINSYISESEKEMDSDNGSCSEYSTEDEDECINGPIISNTNFALSINNEHNKKLVIDLIDGIIGYVEDYIKTHKLTSDKRCDDFKIGFFNKRDDLIEAIPTPFNIARGAKYEIKSLIKKMNKCDWSNKHCSCSRKFKTDISNDKLYIKYEYKPYSDRNKRLMYVIPLSTFIDIINTSHYKEFNVIQISNNKVVIDVTTEKLYKDSKKKKQ